VRGFWEAKDTPITFSGPAEIAELSAAGFTVRQGRNAVGLGIAAVSACLGNSTRRILPGACPNLLREAELCRYATDSRRAETPLDNNDHALGALRYGALAWFSYFSIVRLAQGGTKVIE
jgi:hypothetical protein